MHQLYWHALQQECFYAHVPAVNQTLRLQIFLKLHLITEQDLMKLRRDDDAMIGYYISGIVEFETPLCELLFQRYFGLDK